MPRRYELDTTVDTCPRRDIDHGTARGYAHGCRCDEGRRANTREQEMYALERQRGQYRRVSSIPTRRRVDALRYQGWPRSVLCQRMGLSPRTEIATGPLIRRGIAARVAALYDEIGDQPGPSERMRRRAARLGLVSRWAWPGDSIDDPAALPETGRVPGDENDEIDRVAVQRVLSGKSDGFGLTRLERLWCIQRFTEQGLDAGVIGYRLQINKAQVTEHLAKIAEFGLNPVKRSSLELQRDKVEDRSRRPVVDLTTDVG